MTLVPRNRSLRPMTCVLRETTGPPSVNFVNVRTRSTSCISGLMDCLATATRINLALSCTLASPRIRAKEDLLRFFGNALDFARNEPLGTNVGRSCSLKLNRFTPNCFVYFLFFLPRFLSFLSFFFFEEWVSVWLVNGWIHEMEWFDFVFEIFGYSPGWLSFEVWMLGVEIKLLIKD